MEARPTLQDVAKLAGVGKATASLALRNHPRISEATRARVRAAAEQLQYRPDPALARIAAHRWRTREHPSDVVVAFVTMNHPWTHVEPLSPLRLGAREEAERLGYRLEHFRLDDFPGPEQLARVLSHRGIRGVITGPILREDFAARFPWGSFISIGASRGYFEPPINLVVPDFHHALVHAWNRAAQAGYRRIGVALLKELKAVDLFDKVSAALFCQSRLQPEQAALPVAHFPLEDQAEFRAWLREHRPEVVLGFNDTVYWWMRQAGLRVPEDVAFISLDLDPVPDPGRPCLSGLNPDYAHIGRIAAGQLDILLRTNQLGLPARPLTVHVPSVWIDGSTLPVRPGGSPDPGPRAERAEVAWRGKAPVAGGR